MDIIKYTLRRTCIPFLMSQSNIVFDLGHTKQGTCTCTGVCDNIHTLPLTYLYIPPYTVLLYIVLILVISSCLTSRYIRTYSLIYSANDNARNTPHISIRILTVV